MYQAIHYDYYTRTCYLRDDLEGWNEFQFQSTYYKLHPQGKYKTLDGKRANPTTKYDREDPALYEKDVDINLRILLDIYREFDDVPKWHNKVFLDIETEKKGSINLAHCQAAPGKVTAIAIYDENGKEYISYVLDEKKRLKQSKKNDTKVIPCVSEKELFFKFLDKWQEIDPTIVVHFNGDNFDIPYLYNRMRKIIGENEANRLSPLGIVKFDEFNATKMPYQIAGVNSMDFLRLYKKFIPKQQPSYSLDAISMTELGHGKIKYEGSLDKLFQEDVDKFIEYNVNDVRLIVELDAKKKFLDLAIMVCSIAHVPYHYVYQTSRICEGAIMTFLKRRGIVSVNKPTTVYPELKLLLAKEREDTEDAEKFPGAWVLSPKGGLYGWTLDCDLESLYPCIIRNLNIGTETYLGRIITDNKEDISWGLDGLKQRDENIQIQIESNTGKRTYITIKKLIKIIEESEVLIAPNGVMFSSDEMSAVCSVVSEWFFLRKEYKKKMISAGKEGNHVLESFYNVWQAAIKVCLNAIYGSLGLLSFRYTDPDKLLALTVTMTGRSVNQGSIKFTDDKFNKELGTNGSFALMADTDSGFYNLEKILKHRYPSLNLNDDTSVMEKIRLIAVELPEEINNYYLDYSRQKLNRKGEQFFRTKSEVIYKKLYISKAKQYAAYVVEKEGVVKDEFQFVGLDIIKASFPKLFREFTQGLVKDILQDKSKHYIDRLILDFREKFKTLSMEEVAKPTGLNKYKEYYGGNGTGIFSKTLSKCPINTKAAIYYNDMLKFKGLDERHSIIQVGDKIRWLYLKKNAYNIDVLAYNPEDPVEEIMEFINKNMDREAMFDKNLVNKLQTIYDNLNWGVINYNKNVSKYMKYSV